MRLRFDVEVFDLLPANLQVVAGLKLYQQHFANARELIITVRAPEAEQAENAARAIAERLRRQTSLVDTVTWEPPWLEQPSLTAELLAYLWFNQSPKVFADLPIASLRTGWPPHSRPVASNWPPRFHPRKSLAPATTRSV